MSPDSAPPNPPAPVPSAADQPTSPAPDATSSAPVGTTTTAPAPRAAPPKSKDPLHGITLERIVKELAEEHGWTGLADRVPVRCFQFDPSLKSSLTFLRKTPWARARVERLWLDLAHRR